MKFKQADVVVAVLKTLKRMDCKSFPELAKMCSLENTESFRQQVRKSSKKCSVEYFSLISYGILVNSIAEDGPEGGLLPKERMAQLPEYKDLSIPNRTSEAEDIRVFQEYMLAIKPGVRLCYHLISMGTGILITNVGAQRLKKAIELNGMIVEYPKRCVDVISVPEPVPEPEPEPELDVGKNTNGVPILSGWDFYQYLKDRPSNGVSFLQYDHDSGLLFNMVGDVGAVKWEVVGKISKNVTGDGNDQSL